MRMMVLYFLVFKFGIGIANVSDLSIKRHVVCAVRGLQTDAQEVFIRILGRPITAIGAYYKNMRI